MVKTTKGMTAKQYAQWLHETAMFDYDEACRMAGYCPKEEMKEGFIAFLWAAVAFGAVIFAVWAIPVAAEEQHQLTESALTSCLNGRGMTINNELWICQNTGVKP